MSIRRFAVAASLAAGSLLPNVAGAAPVVGTAVKVQVADSLPGSVSFGVGEPGAISVRVAIDAPATVTLTSPSGALAGMVSGKGTIIVNASATAADVVHGKIWSVTIADAPKGPTTQATVQVTAPGGMFAPAQLSSLSEITSVKRAPLAKPGADLPPIVSSNTTALKVAQSISTTKKLSFNPSTIGTVPVSIIAHAPPPASSPAAPSSPTPPATKFTQITGVAIVGVDPSGNIASKPCAATCQVQGGDMLSISGDGSNGGFTAAANQVHFYALSGPNANTDTVVTPTMFQSNLVVAQVPKTPGTGPYDGFFYVGAGNNPPVESSFYGFHYNPKLVTQYITFDHNQWPHGTHLWDLEVESSILTTGGVELSTSGYLTDPTNFEVAYTAAAFFSGDSWDTILPNITLKNGWLVQSVVFAASGSGQGGPTAWVDEKHEGTSNAQVKVKWHIGAMPSGIHYELRMIIIGEEGVPYF